MSPLEMVFSAIGALLSLICGVLWHSFTKVERKADKAADDLAAFKTEVAKEYATIGMFERIDHKLDKVSDDIQGFFNSMRDRLDSKADRE